GFSLMLEGISYMIGAEVPAVVINVMRGGPGLGNIAPEQSDIKLVCRGLGHGNTHAVVLAPTTPQEMLDCTMEAFRIAFEYRNPVIVAADGYLGQMTGVVKLPDHMLRPQLPDWAVFGDAEHRGNLINSIYLAEDELEAHNRMLEEKYARITAREARSRSWQADDAEILLVACNTPARMAKGAVARLRDEGVKAGMFYPLTLWPFPIDDLLTHLPHVRELVVVEAGAGQLEDEVRLALSKAGAPPIPIRGVRRMGGVVPQEDEIFDAVRATSEVTS
ncbi:MAG: pyruvate ferredoxin oxidoreductase, partial [Gemmatimonadetes bacterium]|nr:pyruvate ferredoxin oxidoreductase [Gemmatimonadota bacterium]